MQHSRTRIIIDGAVAGIIGAVVVALWFLHFDLARGHALETPALLAATILHGVRDPHALHHGLLRLSAEYSVIHFAAFVIVGVVGALLLEAAETEPPFLVSVLIFFGAFEVFFIAVVLFLGPEVMAALTWWGIIVGNLLATAAMLAYFFGQHPMLAKNLLGSGWLRVAREGVMAGIVGGVVVAVWFLGDDLSKHPGPRRRESDHRAGARLYGAALLRVHRLRPGDRNPAGSIGMGTVPRAGRIPAVCRLRGLLRRLRDAARSVGGVGTRMVENRGRKYSRAAGDDRLLPARASRLAPQAGRAMGHAGDGRRGRDLSDSGYGARHQRPRASGASAFIKRRREIRLVRRPPRAGRRAATNQSPSTSRIE